MLKKSIQKGRINLANRLVMPPMATEKSENGKVSEALCDYYKERSGLIGLIITEHSYVMKNGKASRNQLSVGDDCDVNELRKLPLAIHSKGTTKVFAQISHAGDKAKTEITNEPVISVDTLTIEEISKIKKAFVKSALKVKEAGYDGVEIHGAHGYLLNQFYSPLTNHRNDLYGGSVENRIRLSCEIIEDVRSAVGEDFPIAYRFGACDYIDGGATIQDAIEASKYLNETSLDMIDISGGRNGYRIEGNNQPGWFKESSKAIKKVVGTAVMVTGGITTKQQAEQLLLENDCDLVGVGRAILTNPSWISDALLN